MELFVWNNWHGNDVPGRTLYLYHPRTIILKRNWQGNNVSRENLSAK